MTITTDNEIFYAIFGLKIGNFFLGKIDFFNEGSPGSVEFDYNRVRNAIDSGRNLIGFYHTHPNMPAYMSSTDITTMESWVDSEGKELLSLIHGDNGLLSFKCLNHEADGKFVYYNRQSRIRFVNKNYIVGWLL